MNPSKPEAPGHANSPPGPQPSMPRPTRPTRASETAHTPHSQEAHATAPSGLVHQRSGSDNGHGAQPGSSEETTTTHCERVRERECAGTVASPHGQTPEAPGSAGLAADLPGSKARAQAAQPAVDEHDPYTSAAQPDAAAAVSAPDRTYSHASCCGSQAASTPRNSPGVTAPAVPNPPTGASSPIESLIRSPVGVAVFQYMLCLRHRAAALAILCPEAPSSQRLAPATWQYMHHEVAIVAASLGWDINTLEFNNLAAAARTALGAKRCLILGMRATELDTTTPEPPGSSATAPSVRLVAGLVNIAVTELTGAMEQSGLSGAQGLQLQRSSRAIDAVQALLAQRPPSEPGLASPQLCAPVRDLLDNCNNKMHPAVSRSLWCCDLCAALHRLVAADTVLYTSGPDPIQSVALCQHCTQQLLLATHQGMPLVREEHWRPESVADSLSRLQRLTCYPQPLFKANREILQYGEAQMMRVRHVTQGSFLEPARIRQMLELSLKAFFTHRGPAGGEVQLTSSTLAMFILGKGVAGIQTVPGHAGATFYRALVLGPENRIMPTDELYTSVADAEAVAVSVLAAQKTAFFMSNDDKAQGELAHLSKLMQGGRTA